MPFGNFTLDQLARHLGMDAREVRRMAERGSLPGLLVGGQWRFNRAEVLDWINRELHRFDTLHVQSLERAMSDEPDRPMVDALLPIEAIELNLPARSRPSVLRELVHLLERSGQLYDPASILEEMESREQLASTARPGGIAFPHPRRPVAHALARPLIGLARVPAGIPFSAPDRELTDLFIVVCCDDERSHLQTLARLALLLTSDLADRLRAADSAAQARDEIIHREEQLLRERD